MTLDLQQSLAGIVATRPVTSWENGQPRLDMTVAQPWIAHVDDGKTGRTGIDYCHIVMAGVAALRAAGQFHVNDHIVAAGRLTRDLFPDNDPVSGRRCHNPVFEATHIGVNPAAAAPARHTAPASRTARPAAPTSPAWPAATGLAPRL